MTSTETYSTAAEQARSAVERSTDIWKQSTKSLTEQTDVLWQFPQVDLGDVTRSTSSTCRTASRSTRTSP